MHDSPATPGQRFATLIKTARVARGWSQEDLEERSGVSRQTISRYESGKASNPKPEETRAVCRALGIDPREAPIALGYVTREEMGLPPVEPPLPRPLRNAVTLLRSDRIPQDRKDLLLRHIQGAVDFWYEAMGMPKPKKEPSAAERAAGAKVSKR